MVKRWRLVFSICVVIAAIAVLSGCCGLLKGGKAGGAYPTKVDYYLSLNEMVKAGHYDMIHLRPSPSHASKSFQEDGNYGGLVENAWDVAEYSSWRITAGDPANHSKTVEEVQLDLIHFGREMTSAEVRTELGGLGYRPATLAELLAFGAKYPNEQKKYPIVALGSIWQGASDKTYVTYLVWLDQYGRCLSIHTNNTWDSKCYFLAAPK